MKLLKSCALLAQMLKLSLESALLLIFWIGIVLFGIPAATAAGLMYLASHLPLWAAIVLCPVLGTTALLFQFFLMTGAHNVKKT